MRRLKSATRRGVTTIGLRPHSVTSLILIDAEPHLDCRYAPANLSALRLWVCRTYPTHRDVTIVCEIRAIADDLTKSQRRCPNHIWSALQKVRCQIDIQKSAEIPSEIITPAAVSLIHRSPRTLPTSAKSVEKYWLITMRVVKVFGGLDSFGQH